MHITVVRNPRRTTVFFARLSYLDFADTIYAMGKPIGIGIDVLNEMVTTDRINSPISFINK